MQISWRRTLFVCVSCLVVFARSGVGFGAPADELREEARAHYQVGKAAFRREQFREALGEFEKSFALAALPELLFDMGQCHEALHEPAAAARDFERYLVVNPRYEERAELEARIARLRAAAATSPPTTFTPAITSPRPVVDDSARRRRHRALAIGFGVTGGVIVVGAVVLGVVLGTAKVTPYAGNVIPGSQAINP